MTLTGSIIAFNSFSYKRMIHIAIFFFFLETIIAALMHWHKEGWGDYARISVFKKKADETTTDRSRRP